MEHERHCRLRRLVCTHRRSASFMMLEAFSSVLIETLLVTTVRIKKQLHIIVLAELSRALICDLSRDVVPLALQGSRYFSSLSGSE